MSRIIELHEPFRRMSGSICKKSRFCFRSQNGKTYLVRKPSKRSTPYSNEELNRWELFSQVSQKANEMLQDAETRANLEALRKTCKDKKSTLRGFTMSLLYKEAQAELNRQNMSKKVGSPK